MSIYGFAEIPGMANTVLEGARECSDALNLVLEGRPHDLGHGLIVQRTLPSRQRRMVGPFVFWDHAGPSVLPQARKRDLDVRPHPHIGLSTLSYLLAGAIMHRDNLGIEQLIRPGEVNWMTAGSGVVHSERFDDPSVFSGKGLELLQSWVALPEAEEEIDAGFQHVDAGALPEVHDGGVSLRLVAGAALGMQSPVKTYSPLFYLHARFEAGARFTLPAEYAERAAYVVRGRIRIGDGEPHDARRMIVFDGAGEVPVHALEPSVVMFIGGEPIGPRFIWWNFVSSRRERIGQAAADWQAGRMPLPASENGESIPLPELPAMFRA